MMAKGRRTLTLALAGALSGVLMFGSLVLPTAPHAEATTVKDLEDQRAQNRAEREQVEASLEGTDAELAQVYLDLDATRRQLAEARTELGLRQAEAAAADRELQAVRERLEHARKEKQDLSDSMARDQEEMKRASAAMGDIARAAYRGNGNMTSLSVVFNAGSLQEFADSYSAMNNALRNQGTVLGELRDGNVVNENRHARLEAVEERITELEEKAEELLAIAEEKRAQAQVLVGQIQTLESRQQSQAARLEKAIDDGKARLAQLQSSDAKIAEDIKKIQAEEERKREQQASRSQRTPSTPSRPATPAPKPIPAPKPQPPSSQPSKAALIPPISRALYVTSPYGYRVYPITGGWYMHNGVDLRSACGERQFASGAGTVTAVRPAAGNGTHGNQVFINHGTINGATYVTVYNHLSRFAVSRGQTVAQGQTIGYTGATGRVTGCHVHFEVWRNGRTIDPMSLPGFR